VDKGHDSLLAPPGLTDEMMLSTRDAKINVGDSVNEPLKSISPGIQAMLYFSWNLSIAGLKSPASFFHAH
jgi:hypothetical protein